ncbi:MAG: uracil-DNA glycosylase [Patescibacteria group bacterium]
MTDPKRTELMRAIKDELIAFKESPLYEYRTTKKYFPVIGEGSHEAKIVFIGEAPGKNEAEQGRPFCGASGRVLDKLLATIELERKDTYVTNIVKDRPPENRDPSPEEIKLYGPFLNRQLDIIQPKVIATLGRFSMDYVMRMFGLDFEIAPISKAHGKVYTAKASWGEVTIIPLYHPAAALYNGSMMRTLEQDFEAIKKYAYA